MARAVAVVLCALLAACGEERPRGPAGLDADPWATRTDEELTAAIEDARRRARDSGRRVLLELGAEWCSDCREVVRIGRLEPARSVIEERYVVVYVNVGRFDRHRELLREHSVDRIATLVVLDPHTGRRIARTTLEPITGRTPLDPERFAAWLREPGS